MALPASVQAVWLFGSFARHSPSAYSDLDLLVLTEDGATAPDPAVLRSIFALPRLPDVSHYTRAGIILITHPPSLFAWHLRLEANPLFERTAWLRCELESLQAYRSHSEDIEILEQLHHEVYRSIEKDEKSLVFDAGVLGIIARNAGLLLTHFDGQPDFSAIAPLRAVAHPIARLPITTDEYAKLHRSRLAIERGHSVPILSRDAILDVSYRLGMWLRCLRQHFSRRM